MLASSSLIQHHHAPKATLPPVSCRKEMLWCYKGHSTIFSPCPTQQQHAPQRPRVHATANSTRSADATTQQQHPPQQQQPSTALQLRRQQQQWQDLLTGSTAVPPQDQPLTHQQEEEDVRQQHPPAKRPHKAAGFGAASGSNSSSKGARTGSQRQQQQQKQGAAEVQPLDSCPCKSGLRYKDCCQPFLSGQALPRSAPELARARITAALTGDVPYLESSTHPDSSLSLGGARDLERRSKRQAAAFRESKPAVVGMAHCRGDTEGTWLVLAILQATCGESKGTKLPVLSLMAKKHNTPSSNSGGGSGGSGGADAAPTWLYMADTRQLPQHSDADVLWQLLQLHVPEALTDNSSSDGGASSSSSGGISSRDVYFVWTTPCCSTASSSSPTGQWYLDLLQPSVEPLQAAAGAGSRVVGAAAAGSAAAATPQGAGRTKSSSSSIPRGSRRAAVIFMDSIIEARRQSAV